MSRHLKNGRHVPTPEELRFYVVELAKGEPRLLASEIVARLVSQTPELLRYRGRLIEIASSYLASG